MGRALTRHEKKKPWEFWQYPFTPTVLVAERKINWYDIKRFREIKNEMKQQGAHFFWNDPVDEAKHRKHNGVIEIYKDFGNDTDFQSKVEEMNKIIASIKDI